MSRVELGVYKACRPGPSQSFTGLPAHNTHTKHEGLCEYSARGWCSRGVQLYSRGRSLFRLLPPSRSSLGHFIRLCRLSHESLNGSHTSDFSSISSDVMCYLEIVSVCSLSIGLLFSVTFASIAIAVAVNKQCHSRDFKRISKSLRVLNDIDRKFSTFLVVAQRAAKVYHRQLSSFKRSISKLLN